MRIKVHESNDYEQDALDFCKVYGVSLKIGKPKYEKPIWDDRPHYIFPVTITRDGRSMKVNFGQSIAEGSNIPTAYDILATLTKYDPGSFEDFCSEYGYNTDSRKAEQTYKAVQKEWSDVDRVFGDCIDDLQEIQ